MKNLRWVLLGIVIAINLGAILAAPSAKADSEMNQALLACGESRSCKDAVLRQLLPPGTVVACTKMLYSEKKVNDPSLAREWAKCQPHLPLYLNMVNLDRPLHWLGF